MHSPCGRRNTDATRAGHDDRVQISRADFDDPALVDFLTDHLADLEPTAPAESRHALDLSGLRDPRVRLWVAHDGDVLVATGALRALEPGSMEFFVPARTLYASVGFRDSGPFGGYREDPNSHFMTLELTPPAPSGGG